MKGKILKKAIALFAAAAMAAQAGIILPLSASAKMNATGDTVNDGQFGMLDFESYALGDTTATVNGVDSYGTLVADSAGTNITQVCYTGRNGYAVSASKISEESEGGNKYMTVTSTNPKGDFYNGGGLVFGPNRYWQAPGNMVGKTEILEMKLKFHNDGTRVTIYSGDNKSVRMSNTILEFTYSGEKLTPSVKGSTDEMTAFDVPPEQWTTISAAVTYVSATERTVTIQVGNQKLVATGVAGSSSNGANNMSHIVAYPSDKSNPVTVDIDDIGVYNYGASTDNILSVTGAQTAVTKDSNKEETVQFTPSLLHNEADGIDVTSAGGIAWSVTDSTTGEAVTGASISEDGLLTLGTDFPSQQDESLVTTLKITATRVGDGNVEKTADATLAVTNVYVAMQVPTTVEITAENTYKKDDIAGLTFTPTAVVKDADGQLIEAGEPSEVVWSLKEAADGVSINAETGEVTVTAASTASAVTVVATSKTVESVSAEKPITLTESLRTVTFTTPEYTKIVVTPDGKDPLEAVYAENGKTVSMRLDSGDYTYTASRSGYAAKENIAFTVESVPVALDTALVPDTEGTLLYEDFTDIGSLNGQSNNNGTTIFGFKGEANAYAAHDKNAKILRFIGNKGATHERTLTGITGSPMYSVAMNLTENYTGANGTYGLSFKDNNGNVVFGLQMEYTTVDAASKLTDMRFYTSEGTVSIDKNNEDQTGYSKTTGDFTAMIDTVNKTVTASFNGKDYTLALNAEAEITSIDKMTSEYNKGSRIKLNTISILGEKISSQAVLSAVTDAEYDMFGKKLAELGTDIAIDANNKATGKLNYVTNYTDFSDAPEQQQGYYMPVVIAAPEGKTISADAVLKLIGTETYTYTGAQVDADGTYAGKWVNVVLVSPETKQLTFTVDWDGAGEDYAETTYILDLSAMTKQAFSTAEFTTVDTASQEDLYGKKAADLVNDVTVTDSAISGTLNYVSGYTDFSSIVWQQQGYYLPMVVTLPEGVDPANCKVQLLNQSGEVSAEYGYADFNTTGDYVGKLVNVVILTHNDVHAGKLTYVVDLDGDGADYLPQRYEFDLSGLNLPALYTVAGTTDSNITAVQLVNEEIVISGVITDGSVLFENVPDGSYTVEARCAEGYKLSAMSPVAVAGGNVSGVTITSEEDKDPTYTVSGTADAHVTSVKLKSGLTEYIGTIQAGVLTVENVKAGTYQVVVVYENGYEADGTVAEITVADSNYTGLEIKSKQTTYTVSGVTDSHVTEVKLVGEQTYTGTIENNVVTFTGVAAGTYTVEATYAQGYEKADDATTQVVVENKDITTGLKFTSKETPAVTYTVSGATDEHVTGVKLVGTQTYTGTIANNVVTFTGVAAGTYTVEATYAQGYEKADDATAQVVVEDKDITDLKFTSKETQTPPVKDAFEIVKGTGTVSVKALDGNKAGFVYVAEYDANGMMTGIKAVALPTTADASTDPIAYDTTAAKVLVFVWNGTQTPYMGATYMSI